MQLVDTITRPARSWHRRRVDQERGPCGLPPCCPIRPTTRCRFRDPSRLLKSDHVDGKWHWSAVKGCIEHTQLLRGLWNSSALSSHRPNRDRERERERERARDPTRTQTTASRTDVLILSDLIHVVQSCPEFFGVLFDRIVVCTDWNQWIQSDVYAKYWSLRIVILRTPRAVHTDTHPPPPTHTHARTHTVLLVRLFHSNITLLKLHSVSFYVTGTLPSIQWRI